MAAAPLFVFRKPLAGRVVQKRLLPMRKILQQLCEWKKVTIVEAEVCPDHS